MLVTLNKPTHRRGASAARKAHNLEVTGSTPVAGILSLRSLYCATAQSPASSWDHQKLPVIASDVKHCTLTLYRSGAGVARGAHNPEARCSNHLSGILSLRQFYRIWPSSWTLNAAF